MRRVGKLFVHGKVKEGLPAKMLEGTSGEREGKAVWLFQGKASRREEVRVTKAELEKCVFRNGKEVSWGREGLARREVVEMTQRKRVRRGSSHQILLGSRAQGSQTASCEILAGLFPCWALA